MRQLCVCVLSDFHTVRCSQLSLLRAGSTGLSYSHAHFLTSGGNFLCHMYVYFVCIHICVPPMWLVLQEAEDGMRTPGTEVTDVCEWLCGC